MLQEVFKKRISFAYDDWQDVKESLERTQQYSKDYQDYILKIINYEADQIGTQISVKYQCEQQPKSLKVLRINNHYDKVELFNQLLMMAQFLDQYQIYHGNIKPSNIIQYKGKLYLVDFLNSAIQKQNYFKYLSEKQKINFYPYITTTMLQIFCQNSNEVRKENLKQIEESQTHSDKIKQDIYAIGSIMLYLFTGKQFNNSRFTDIKNLINSKEIPNQVDQIFEETSLPTGCQNLIKQTIQKMLKEQQLPNLRVYRDRYNDLKSLYNGMPNFDKLIEQCQFNFKNSRIKTPNKELSKLQLIQPSPTNQENEQLILNNSTENRIISEFNDEETNNSQLNKNFQQNNEQQDDELQEDQNQFSHVLSQKSREVNSQQSNYQVKSFAELIDQINGYEKLNKFLRIFLKRKIVEDLSDNQKKRDISCYLQSYKIKNEDEIEQFNNFERELIKYSQENQHIYHYIIENNNLSGFIFYYQINDKSCIFKTKIYRGKLSSKLEPDGNGEILNYQQYSKYVGNWKDGKEEDTNGIWERLENQYLKYGDIYKYQGSFKNGLFEGKGSAFLNHQNTVIREGQYRKGRPVYCHKITKNEELIGYEFFLGCLHLRIK